MTRPLSIGLAGLGTVGIGVLRLLRENAETVTARAGRPLAVSAVSARDRARDRGVSLGGLRWYDDPVALAADPGVDVIVELIGGADGPGDLPLAGDEWNVNPIAAGDGDQGVHVEFLGARLLPAEVEFVLDLAQDDLAAARDLARGEDGQQSAPVVLDGP